MSNIQRLHVNRRMSQAVVHGGVVYTAGVVASDASADTAGQTRQILETLDRYLAEAGSDRTRILMATIWLADMNDFAAMNSEWDAWVPEGETPARACVEARLALPELRVEIRLVAAVG